MLLMGSSLGTTLGMWDRQRPLSERMKVVLFDHRGHGGSPVPPPPYEIEDLGRDVLSLMDELGLRSACYCGVSLGGMVGMWLAAHAPERIDRLVLVCTSAYMPPASLWQERAAAVLGADSVASIADSVVQRWVTPDYASEHPEVRDELHAMLASTPPAGYAACCGAIERMDLRESLSAVAAPTLVVSGSEDASTPREHQELIAAGIRGARHEIVSPAAHLAPVEQPGQINRLILEHTT